jgi:hypothetical protein
MHGWAGVVFRCGDTGRREVIAIDDLVRHLEDWERR